MAMSQIHCKGWAALIIACVTALSVAATASAAPKGKFAVFADCPTKTAGLELCLYGQTTGGEFTLGSTKVPINKTITLQGGALPAGEINSYVLLPATDGNTLSKTELNVPGGLLNLINCTEIKGEGLLEKTERASCKLVFENGTTGVTATTELVATAGNPALLNTARLFLGIGTALTLPVRVHLKNPLLGEGCYVGSASHPVQLQLTTGTTAPPPPNKPISGSLGELTEEIEHERSIFVLSKNTLVDNSFSAPVAEGCGGLFAFLIDPLLDAKIGLPAAAGHNTAILSGTLKTTLAENVIASETF